VDNEVLEFIEKFKQYEQGDVLHRTFTNGYCYYFAIILQERFGGEILYDPIEGHFVTRILDDYFGIHLYDITGEVTNKYDWSILQPKTYWMKNGRIIRGVILKDGKTYEI